MIISLCFFVRLDYQESFTNDLDPSVVGSTVTLMGQMPDTKYDESLQGNNIPSPVRELGSVLLCATFTLTTSRGGS